MNVARWLIRNAHIRGEAPALALGTKVLLTHRELAQRVAVLAAALRGRLGLAPGDRVALFMKNQPHYLEALYAVWHAGLVAVPINAKLHSRECAWIIENSGARVCFCSPDVESAVASEAIDGLDTLITAGSAEYRALLNGEPAARSTIAASQTILRGCFIRLAPPAVPRAQCFRTATWWR